MGVRIKARLALLLMIALVFGMFVTAHGLNEDKNVDTKGDVTKVEKTDANKDAAKNQKASEKSDSESEKADSDKSGGSEDVLENADMDELYKVYDHALFIGDSRTEGMRLYSEIDNADFFCGKALTVESIADGKVVTIDNQSMSVYDLLKSRTYDKIYIALGMNDLGSPSVEGFIEHYQDFIKSIQKLQPGAEIYVEMMFPINPGMSKASSYINNDNIAKYNKEIAKMAEKMGLKYLNPDKPLVDANGSLKAEATSDGVHVNSEYCKKWAMYLAQITY